MMKPPQNVLIHKNPSRRGENMKKLNVLIHHMLRPLGIFKT
jgi:hypothetical protein